MKYEPFNLDKWKSGNYNCQTIGGAIVKNIIINKNVISACDALEVEFADSNDKSIIPCYKNYYKNGSWNLGFPGIHDLILIKKENSMESKEIKIVPPEGYIIDKENSTYNCIKFKPAIKRWRDDTNARFGGWYINSGAEIIDINDMFNTKTAYNVFVTREQAKSALAMARISQIMVNDKRFGGSIPDEDWKDHDMPKYCIIRYYEEISREFRYNTYCFLAFHTREQRDLFLEENEDLVKDYLML